MSAPVLVIRVEFEARPVVYIEAAHEGDADRLGDWLEHTDDEQVQAAARLAAAVGEKAA